jgi:hypothetical protein
VYGFSSLVKQNKKGKNCAVFCFAGFFFKIFLCYEVIVKQKIYKRSTNHYSCWMSSAFERTNASTNSGVPMGTPTHFSPATLMMPRSGSAASKS